MVNYHELLTLFLPWLFHQVSSPGTGRAANASWQRGDNSLSCALDRERCTCNANTLKFVANEGEVSPWFTTRGRVCLLERCSIYRAIRFFRDTSVRSLLSSIGCAGFLANFPVEFWCCFGLLYNSLLQFAWYRKLVDRRINRNLMNVIVCLDPQLRRSNIWSPWI